MGERAAQSGREDPSSIEISFSHPSRDPVGISRQLSMEPSRSWKRGDRFGSEVKSSSLWYGLLAAGAGAAEYEAALAQVASFLGQHDDFFADFRDGSGETVIVLNHAAIE